MKKLLATAALGAALVMPLPTANAMPDFCADHVDTKDQSDGVQKGERSIPACEEAGGQQYGNQAVTPDAVPHPDAREPLSPVDQGDLGTYDDGMNVLDEDGLQAADVRNSPIFVPGS